MAPKKRPTEPPNKAANPPPPTTDYAQIQQDEFDAIQAIYPDGFEEIKTKAAWGAASQSKSFRLCLKPFNDTEVAAVITVAFTPSYPRSEPILKLERTHGLRDKTVRAIKNVLLSVPKSSLGQEMIHEITSAIEELLNDEAEHRAKGETLPDLNEERKQKVQEQELKRIETKEREETEENRNLQLMVDRERQRQVDNARKKKSESIDQPGVPESVDPETVDFDRAITFQHDTLKFTFTSVGGITSLGKGPVTEVYTVYPRVSFPTGSTGVQSAPTLLVMKKCKLPHPSDGKQRVLDLETELEALKRAPLHSNCVKLLEYRMVSLPDGWDLNVLLEFSNRGSLGDLLDVWERLPTSQLRAWTTDLLDALHFYHLNSIVHGRVRPNNVLLFHSTTTGNLTVKLSDAEFQKTLYQIHGRPAYPSAWSVNWKPFELSSDQPHKSTKKTDIWDLGILFLQMIFKLDVPERYKGPSDILNLNLSTPLKTIINDFFRRDPSKRPTAWELKPSDFLRNEHPIYEQDSTPEHLMSSPINQSYSIVRRHQRSTSLDAGNQLSRFATDWDQLERVGRGGFGKVFKARNRMDTNIYAIKKIRQPESLLSKVIPEIMMLSRVNHPNVVRYYSAWIEKETADTVKSPLGSDDEETSDIEETTEFHSRITPRISHGLDFVSSETPNFIFATDSDDEDRSLKEGGSEQESDEEFSDDDESNPFESRPAKDVEPPSEPKQVRFPEPNTIVPRYASLYIQMEFCERQTLRDLIHRGLDKNIDEVWRLFRKIVSGLAHIHEAGIIHRDLKPENIFIDTANSPKIGDFGLATSGVHAPAPKRNSSTLDADMTKGIGTASYVAPEVLSNTPGTYTEKVDMYSLGVIFFEMCYPFPHTSMERAKLVEDIRKKECILPDGFQKPENAKQRELILALLNHRPSERPTAKSLLKGGNIPIEVGDDQVQELLTELANPDSDYYQIMMDNLFKSNQMSEVKATTWDSANHNHGNKAETNGDKQNMELLANEIILMGEIKNKLGQIFRYHGALEVDRPAIFPRSELYDNKNIVQLISTSGTQLQLPYDLRFPMARAVARVAPVAQRSYSFGRVFREGPLGGKPKVVSEVDFDIISKDALDVALKEAEVIKVLDQSMEALPNFASTETYFHVNHWDLLELILEACRIEPKLRASTKDALSRLGNRGVTWAMLRSDLRQSSIGIPSTSLDDLGKFDFRDSPDKVFRKLKKLLSDPQHQEQLPAIIKSIRAVLNYTKEFGVKRKIFIAPLSCFHAEFYESGIMFQLMIDHKQHKDVIAEGGRYDRLIQLQKPKGNQASFNNCYGVGFSLGFDSLVRLIVQLQMKSKSGSLKKHAKNVPPNRIPVRRCDILVASFDTRILRSCGLRILSHLWDNQLIAELATDVNSVDDLVARYLDEKHSWAIIVKSEAINLKTPVTVVSLPSKHDIDITLENLCAHLHNAIRDRDTQESNLIGPNSSKTDRSGRATTHRGSTLGTAPVFTSSDPSKPPNVHFLVGSHKGKKTNRATAIDAASSAIASLLASYRDNAPVAAVETDDSLLEAVSTSARLSDAESWRRVVQQAPANDRSYLVQLQEMLQGFRAVWMEKEDGAEKSRIAFVFNFRTGWICAYDLGL
jgi:eukaryotic translation initiation factor 2-alpha kinase 4